MKKRTEKIKKGISRIGFILLLLLFVTKGFGSDLTKQGFISISATEANHIINTYQNLLVIDVGSSLEFDDFHMTGAVSIPLETLKDNLPSIDKNKRLLIYGHSKQASEEAATFLYANGYKSIYNLETPINNWRKKELPLIAGKATQTSARAAAPLKSQQTVKTFEDYCSSVGGSHSYEYIQNVNYSIKSEGIFSITIFIGINNPDNCTYGEPCPSYDQSPEYVNAWIDWNGDGVFSSDEKIVDAALTGYMGINYSGSMSTSNILSIPAKTVGTTTLRINLGWSYDPNDPCAYSWSWGDVMDLEVEIYKDPPTIKDITVKGKPFEKNPVTNDPSYAGDEKVILEADIEEKDNYEVTEINWSGDCIPGKGKKYEYTAPAGSHGKKKVTCTITYKDKSSEALGIAEMSKEFKLFFIRVKDDDGDGKPNWFKYWKTDKAVPNISPAKYDPAEDAYGYMTSGGDLYLTKYSSGQHYSSPIVLTTSYGNESFGGPDVKGIDCAAEIIAHENYHKWVNDQWKTGGSFKDKLDSDKGVPSASYQDKLPNFYEKATSKTDTTKNDTYNLAVKKAPDYKYYGDNEYMAMRTGDGARGVQANDWSFPGKQSDPKYGPTADGPEVELKAQLVAYTPVDGEFTGTFSNELIDEDNNGAAEYLRVNAEVNVISGGVFKMVGKLFDGNGDLITFTNEAFDLEPGVQTLVSDFSGIDIQNYGVDGPYTVSLKLSNDFGDKIDLVEDLTTDSYSINDFQPKDAVFTNEFSHQGIDLNSDDLYDILSVDVSIQVNKSGTYTVEGGLYDKNGDVIEFNDTTLNLETGSNVVTLKFNGNLIYQSKESSPYYLKYLGISSDVAIDFILDAYTIDGLSFTDFQSNDAHFFGDLDNSGKDTDNDGKFNFLTIKVGIQTLQDETLKLIGKLYDNEGNQITEAEQVYNLTAGTSTVDLDFEGVTIFSYGVDGPYVLKELRLINEAGLLMDLISDSEMSLSYNYTDFQDPGEPIVTLTGNYNDYKNDLDQDCVYDFLTVDAEIDLRDAGFVVIQGRLVDGNDEEIGWAQNIIQYPENGIQTIELNFDGKDIFTHEVDGPYYLENVYVYHTGDPTLPDYVVNAATTDTYYSADFDTIAGNPINIERSICQGDVFSIGENNFSEAGTYTIDYGENGCTKSLVLDLIVNEVNEININASICKGESYEFGAENFTEAGTYSLTLTNQFGCDSIINLNLTVSETNFTNIDASICEGETYTFGNESLTQTGAYTLDLINQFGCDSTVNLTLFVNAKNETNLNVAICKGEAYTFGNETLTEGGSYSNTLKNLYDCDSTVNLELVVNDLPNVWLGNDTTITEAGNLTIDVGSEFTLYNWSTGETAQSINFEGSNGIGDHAVSVTVTDQNTCVNSDTIIITVIEATGIDQLINDGNIQVYPNPTDGRLNMRFINLDQSVDISIYNNAGQLVHKEFYSPDSSDDLKSVDLSEYPTGHYIIEFKTNNGKVNKLILKK